MNKTRKSYPAQFKARVALEAMSQMKTIQELAAKYEISPIVISKWKAQLQKEAANIFENPLKKSQKDRDYEKEKEELYKQIGQQKVEIDWMKKKAGLFGL